MRKFIASLFAVALLAATSMVFVPAASARDGGNSCDNISYVSWDTPAYNHQSGNSEQWWCD
jgi:hypothetical protein